MNVKTTSKPILEIKDRKIDRTRLLRRMKKSRHWSDLHNILSFFNNYTLHSSDNTWHMLLYALGEQYVKSERAIKTYLEKNGFVEQADIQLDVYGLNFFKIYNNIDLNLRIAFREFDPEFDGLKESFVYISRYNGDKKHNGSLKNFRPEATESETSSTDLSDYKNFKIDVLDIDESLNNSMLPFIQEELYEAKVLKDSTGLINRSSQDIAELAFLTILALNIIKYYNDGYTTNYARWTTMFNGFDGIRSTCTDLHNYLAVLEHLPRFTDKMTPSFTGVISVPKLQLMTHLKNISRGDLDPSKDSGVLLALQQQLRITNSNYKSVRRLVQDWHRTLPKEKALATTRLLQAFRFKAPQADIFKPLEAIARIQGLELKNVNNPEEISTKR